MRLGHERAAPWTPPLRQVGAERKAKEAMLAMDEPKVNGDLQVPGDRTELWMNSFALDKNLKNHLELNNQDNVEDQVMIHGWDKTLGPPASGDKTNGSGVTGRGLGNGKLTGGAGNPGARISQILHLGLAGEPTTGYGRGV